MTRERLELGISTCPNDTFAFHGLLAGEVDPCGFEFAIELADVQSLNEQAAAGRCDALKLSFAAALRLSDELLVLPVGAALGRGVGPVVLAPRRSPASPVVLAPGEDTTATLLWRLFHPGEGPLRQVVFSQIMPALARGEARCGVCIHEGRFTYGGWGLELVEDLGARWEAATGLALPLGGIVARRTLGAERTARLARAIRGSLDFARAHPERALSSMRRYAQEHSDEVLRQHVELYVTDETAELSADGERALAELARRAREAGAPVGRSPLEVARLRP